MTEMSPATGGQGPAPPAAWMACAHTHALPGAVAGPDHDSLLAKIIAWGQDRDQALARLRRALRELRLAEQGIRTTAPLLADLLAAPVFRAARHDMEMLDHQTAAIGSADPARERSQVTGIAISDPLRQNPLDNKQGGHPR